MFWTRGYQATSVQDLVDALGVQRGSLYATFGDKHDLYLRAVDLYARDNRARLEAALASGPVLPALRRMLTQPAVLTGASTSGPRRGCLVGNTTAQLTGDDEAARSVITAAFEQSLPGAARPAPVFPEPARMTSSLHADTLLRPPTA